MPDTDNEPNEAEDMPADERIPAFERQIAEHEELLYGVALFFEGLSCLYAGQEAVIETHRKQFRNIIQIGKETIQRASGLLQRAKRNPEKADLFRHFAFMPCVGHPKPEELAERARIMVETYRQIFPGRPRGQPFSTGEIMRLMEAAAMKL